MTTKVWYTNEGFFDPDTRTYEVAEVIQGEPGYIVHSRWETLELAVAEARRLNIEANVPVDAVIEVVVSSMRAGRVTQEPIVLVREPLDDAERPSIRNARRGLMLLEAYRVITGSDEDTDAEDLIADVLHAVDLRSQDPENGADGIVRSVEYVLERAATFFANDDEDFS